MSSREQLAIMDLIAGMKKANKRRAYGTASVLAPTPVNEHDTNTVVLLPDSDSDSDIEHTNNRGNKLKKRARFVRQGKLGPPTGPSVYREASRTPKLQLRHPSSSLHGLSRSLSMLATSAPS